jgi:hypothetical protein
LPEMDGRLLPEMVSDDCISCGSSNSTKQSLHSAIQRSSFCTAMNKLALQALQRILKFYSTPSSRFFFTHFCSGCYLPSLASEFWIIQSIAKMLRVTQSVGDRSSWIGARSQVGEGIIRNDGNSLHFSKRLSERLSAMLREDSVKTSLY